MSLAKFNNLIASIEAKYPNFFKNKSIHTYYIYNHEAFDDINVKNDRITFPENTDLPDNIRKKLQMRSRMPFLKTSLLRQRQQPLRPMLW